MTGREGGLRPAGARTVCSAPETAHNPNRFRPDGAGRAGEYRQRCLHAEVAGNEIRSSQTKDAAHLYLFVFFASSVFCQSLKIERSLFHK